MRGDEYNWRDDAGCKGLPIELLFVINPFEGTDRAHEFTPKPHYFDKARKICETCPVKVDCLESAVKEEWEEVPFVFGIRGGLSPKQRMKLIYDRKRENRRPLP